MERRHQHIALLCSDDTVVYQRKRLRLAEHLPDIGRTDENGRNAPDACKFGFGGKAAELVADHGGNVAAVAADGGLQRGAVLPFESP